MADSDRPPICTVLDVVTDVVEIRLRKCWEQLNEKQLVDSVTANISTVPTPIDGEKIDGIVKQLIAVVQQGIQLSCPIARSSQWANRAWTPECTVVITAVIKLSRKASRCWRHAKCVEFEPSLRELARQELRDELHDDYTHAKNGKGKRIGKAL